MPIKLFPLAIACLLALFSAPIAAGQNIVQEIQRQGRPCFRLDFAKTSEDLVEKLWKDFVKTQFDGKLKKDKVSGDWAALGLQSNLVSSDNFDLYSRIESYAGDGASLLVWFDVGGGFLNRRDDADRTENTVDALKQFYYAVRREVIQKELAQQENKLKDLEKRLRSLKKDNESLHADIENYKAKIKKAEDDIVRNEQEQSKSLLEIEAQKKATDDVRMRLENVERSN